METLWGKLAKREKELNMSKMGARDLSHAVKAMKTALEQGRKDAKVLRERLAGLEVRVCRRRCCCSCCLGIIAAFVGGGGVVLVVISSCAAATELRTRFLVKKKPRTSTEETAPSVHLTFG